MSKNKLVTAKTLAKTFGCTVSYISSLKKGGMPIAQKGSNGKGGRSPDLFDLEICKAWRAMQMGLSSEEDEQKLLEEVPQEPENAESAPLDDENSYHPADKRISKLSKLSLDSLKKRKLATEIAKEEELGRSYKIRADREIGLLVSIEEAQEFVSRLYGLVRGRLDSLPASLCNKLAAETDADAVYTILEDWVDEVRSDLSEDLGELLTDAAQP